MLKKISISNYAIIDELTVSFDNGLTVITGETGAGKSIIIGALSLILGQRADSKVIREREQKCVIEAVFELSSNKYKLFFQENDLDYSSQCIIRREILANGKSRAFINDTPVSLNILKEFVNQLIDIHSQHENLLLANENYQLLLVDNIAENEKIKNAYEESFSAWNSAEKELTELKKEVYRSSAEQDYLQYQFEQLKEANLTESEQSELEEEQEKLTHVEEIKRELIFTEDLISDGEINILKNLRESSTALDKILDYLPQVAEWSERIYSLSAELKDIYAEIHSIQEQTEYEPERLQWIENRLDTIYTLQRKFKLDSVESLLEFQAELEKKLLIIQNFDEELAKAKEKVNIAKQNLTNHSVELTNSRKKIVPMMEKHLVERLRELSIPNVNIQITVNELDNFTIIGKDDVRIKFSANKNYSPQNIENIASGGEMSRIMLALKSLFTNVKQLPTIIFDEVDTGISGESAKRVGELLRKMSESMQVIAISHLPQIAAKADNHLYVYKEESDKTTTLLKKLSSQERETEIAQLISGKDVTEAALKNARELIGSK